MGYGEVGKSELMYVLAIILVATTAWTGSSFTDMGVKSEWYDCVRPGLTPPSKIFPWVWTTLYVMIAIGLGRALASGNMLLVGLFIVNLILNAMWCYWYFYMRNIAAALFTIGLLWATTMAITVVGEDDKLILVCTLPYLGWISFAALLNMLSLNRASTCAPLEKVKNT